LSERQGALIKSGYSSYYPSYGYSSYGYGYAPRYYGGYTYNRGYYGGYRNWNGGVNRIGRWR